MEDIHVINNYVDKKFKNIIHLADIHIRNKKDRDEEYQLVFNNLYERIRLFNMDSKNLIIAIAGDILDMDHGKGSKITPTAIKLTKNFIYKLSKLGIVVMIAGNHDNNIKYQYKDNKNATDVLSSILTNIRGLNKNIFYFRDSGKYVLGNCIFYVTSVFDIDIYKSNDDYPKRLELLQKRIEYPNIDHHIGLLHCGVQSQVLSNGHMLTNYSYTLSDLLNQYDITLLGDTHELQFLTPTIAYPNSLIQQNFGEKLDNHGFIKWDLETNTGNFYKINNRFGFVSIKNLSTIDNIIFPLKSHIKLELPNNIDDYEVEQIKTSISKKTEIISFTNKKHIKSNSDSINNNKKSIETNLIKYLEDNYEDEEFRQTILNKFSNDSKNIHNLQTSSYKYEVIKLQIINFLSYDNEILDLSNINKHSSICINGDNGDGKSNILYALSYVLWGSKVLNGKLNTLINSSNPTKTAKCILELLYKDQLYKIERSIIKSKKVYKEVLVLYNKIGDSWVNISHKSKKEIEEQIKNICGDYETAFQTYISLQNKYDRFLTDNKNINTITTLLNHEFYTEIHTKNTNDIKNLHENIIDINGQLKYLQKQIKSNKEIETIQQELNSNDITINNNKNEISILENKVEKLKEKYYNFNRKINNKQKQINLEKELEKEKEHIHTFNKFSENYTSNDGIQINNEINTIEEQIDKYYSKKLPISNINKNDINKLSKNRDAMVNEKTLLEVNITNYNNTITSNEKLIEEYDIDIEEIETNSKIYDEYLHKKQLINRDITKTNRQLNKFKCCSFNESCDNCINNKQNLQINTYENELETQQQELHTCITTINEMKPYKLLLPNCKKLLDLEENNKNIYTKISQLNNEKEKLEIKIDNINEKIDEHTTNYNKYLSNLNTNKEIDLRILKLKQNKTKLTNNYNILLKKNNKFNILRELKISADKCIPTILTKIQNITKQIVLKEHYDKDTTIMNKLIKDITNFSNSNIILYDENTKLQSYLENNIRSCNENNNIKKGLDTLKEKEGFLIEYGKIFDPIEGFPNYLIIEAIRIINIEVNNVIHNLGFTFKTIHELVDGNKIKGKYKLITNFIKNSNEYTRLSGAETFIYSIAIRISLNRISCINSNNICI